MAIETERRFLIKPEDFFNLVPLPDKIDNIKQGYLSDDPERTIRVRIVNNRDAFITIKGKKVEGAGAEFEYRIPVDDALQMMEMSKAVLIKDRGYIPYDSTSGLMWEIDYFMLDNRGLIIAEIELDDINFNLELPDWIGEEITDDTRYANSNLANYPYSKWKELLPRGSIQTFPREDLDRIKRYSRESGH